jgi:hypothetical protein
MRIETDVKLDFKDVLIRPKRSTLNSRNEVDIHRSFRFYHTARSGRAFRSSPPIWTSPARWRWRALWASTAR